MEEVKRFLYAHYEEHLEAKFYASNLAVSLSADGDEPSNVKVDVDWDSTYFIQHHVPGDHPSDQSPFPSPAPASPPPAPASVHRLLRSPHRRHPSPPPSIAAQSRAPAASNLLAVRTVRIGTPSFTAGERSAREGRSNLVIDVGSLLSGRRSGRSGAETSWVLEASTAAAAAEEEEE
ncbi:hypothetical protein HU200_013717 [Digitaria exilis]|uniref:Uncharacterized protein n=1 Tax=Digitaria exilis TaxID=1010633 RepID=A0A835FDE6_9POAL|nr:hypothetical protein HU200_013717 [Digitaria exilis]